MKDADSLFTTHEDVQFDEPPVLLHAFVGFVDAGAGVRMAVDHLVQTLDHVRVATFDPDALLDYRARRPRMVFERDHFALAEVPEVTLLEMTDPAGQRFLLLAGPEPDYQWRRFLGAVDVIVERYGVRLAVGLGSIPWPSPHTRPLGLAVHGSDPRLLLGHTPVIGEIEVPGHVGAMLELHLGEQGLPSMGVTAQVPHYLAQVEYPRAAMTLLQGVAALSGLSLQVEGLAGRAAEADADVAAQLAGNEEFAAVLVTLEQQYDQVAATVAAASGTLSESAGSPVPSGDEIAAQVEEFLSSLDSAGDEDKTA
jgi:hypothetical protein